MCVMLILLLLGVYLVPGLRAAGCARMSGLGQSEAGPRDPDPWKVFWLQVVCSETMGASSNASAFLKMRRG